MKVGATAKSREGSHLFTFTNGLVVRAGTLSELLAFFFYSQNARFIGRFRKDFIRGTGTVLGTRMRDWRVHP